MSSLIKSFELLFSNIKNNIEYNVDDLTQFEDFIIKKFSETENIFKLFEKNDFVNFIKLASIINYKDNDLIYKQDEINLNYIFIIHGDINFFDSENEDKKLVKTLTSGNLYGHKIKEKFKLFVFCRVTTTLIVIDKNKFNDLIDEINKRKLIIKQNYLKKSFPLIKLFPDCDIEDMTQYFLRMKYSKYSKIFKNNYNNEFLYLIISGEVAVAKRPQALLSESNIEKISPDCQYINIQTYKPGNILGLYSCLSNKKCYYTALVISNECEVYKFPKTQMLNYFSRNNGFILKKLVQLDTQIQQTNEKKINFIKENQDEFFNKIEFICYNKNLEKNCTEEYVDEIYIRNTIKEAWKNLENLDKNISLFKDNLLNGKVDNKNPLKLFSNNNNENKDKDFKALSGDGTNRLASRKLNSMNKNQLKSLQKLEMFCGVKKEEKDNIKLIMEINSKMEGNRENSITKELKAANKINNNNNEEKKENNEEKKDNNNDNNNNDNNNNDNKNNNDNNNISNNNNDNNIEQPKKKFKRPKHSLKNLLE